MKLDIKKEEKMETKEVLEKELALITINREWLDNSHCNPEILKLVLNYREQILTKLIDLEKKF